MKIVTLNYSRDQVKETWTITVPDKNPTAISCLQNKGFSALSAGVAISNALQSSRQSQVAGEPVSVFISSQHKLELTPDSKTTLHNILGVIENLRALTFYGIAPETFVFNNDNGEWEFTNHQFSTLATVDAPNRLTDANGQIFDALRCANFNEEAFNALQKLAQQNIYRINRMSLRMDMRDYIASKEVPEQKNTSVGSGERMWGSGFDKYAAWKTYGVKWLDALSNDDIPLEDALQMIIDDLKPSYSFWNSHDSSLNVSGIKAMMLYAMYDFSRVKNNELKLEKNIAPIEYTGDPKCVTKTSCQMVIKQFAEIASGYTDLRLKVNGRVVEGLSDLSVDTVTSAMEGMPLWAKAASVTAAVTLMPIGSAIGTGAAVVGTGATVGAAAMAAAPVVAAGAVAYAAYNVANGQSPDGGLGASAHSMWKSATQLAASPEEPTSTMDPPYSPATGWGDL